MTPTDVATRFFDLLKRQAWLDAARLIEPGQAARFQREELAHAVAWLRYQELLRGPEPHPSGFGSSGEIDDDTLNAYATAPVPGYGDARTLGSIRDLDPAEFLARRFAIGHQVPRYQTGPQGEPVEVPVRVLGHLPYSSDLAYVVYIHDSSIQEDHPRVLGDAPYAQTLPMFRHGQRWYVGLNVDVMMNGPEPGMFDRDNQTAEYK